MGYTRVYTLVYPDAGPGFTAVPGMATPGRMTPGYAPSTGAAALAVATPARLAVAVSFPAPAVKTGTAAQPTVLAVATSFPAPVIAGGVNPLPAVLTVAVSFGSPAVNATVIAPALELSGFGTFPPIAAGSSIVSITAVITWFGSDAGIGAPTYELWDSANGRIGTAQLGTASTLSSHTDTVTFTGATFTQLATLRLRFYGNSGAANSGATANVDAAGLTVSYTPPQDGLVTTAAQLAVATGFPPPAVSAGGTALPGVLAVAATFPQALTGEQDANISAGTLTVATTFPAASPGTGSTITIPVLTCAAFFPQPLAVTNGTGPGYAATAAVLAGGSGTWSSTASATGPPDASDALWTVP